MPQAQRKGASEPAEGVEVDVPSAHTKYLESVMDPDKEVPVHYASVNPGDSEVGVVTEEGYVGTDPIYQNYADDTHKPYAAEDGPEADAEEAFVDAYEGEPNEGSDLLKENYEATSRTDKQEEEEPVVESSLEPAVSTQGTRDNS